MQHFLSCDWGTSSFRLKLIEINTLQTVVEAQSNDGIASTFKSWEENSDEKSRVLFFASVIKAAISQLENKLNSPLSGVPIVLSGMASSSLGMIYIPYKQVPFKTDGSDLKIELIKTSADFDHDVILISGVCSETDVMRGEETQLVGASDRELGQERVYIFPGTHSKHIHVKGNNVSGFKTYMTGEIFALLSKSSTLTEAVEAGGGLLDASSIETFKQGVLDSVQSNLLHSLFTVRTRFLLQKVPRLLNHCYLSGLLIGYEVHDLIDRKLDSITVVSSNLRDHYEIALSTLDIAVPVILLEDLDVTVKGQFAIISCHPEISSYFND
jgi:2-dehydro-3-deoxygalactonokinase